MTELENPYKSENVKQPPQASSHEANLKTMDHNLVSLLTKEKGMCRKGCGGLLTRLIQLVQQTQHVTNYLLNGFQSFCTPVK